MNALAIDHDLLFSIQVRALQEMYPTAHASLQHWGEWSRDIGKVPGLTNHISPPSLWDQCVTSKFDDWADEQAPQVPVGQDVRMEVEKSPYDERVGEELDKRINDQRFPTIWRRVLKVAYLYRVPEYQFPRLTRVTSASFLMFLEGALGRIGAD